jgi:nucleotide-binding universal stress UspA family protein
VPTFEKLLVPVDGSQGAIKAAQVAGEIARKFDSRVTLLHVVDSPDAAIAAAGMAGMVWAGQDADETLEKAGREALAAAREAAALPGDRVTKQIMAGHAADTIVQAAKEGGFDLIVMGSRGLSEVSSIFLGSVSDKVSHHAPCPVLIVR